MPIYGLSITKQISWHGQPEAFSNTYHYESGVFDNLTAGALIDQVLDAERKVHSNQVRFLEGRVWEAGGTAAENDTILIRDLTDMGVLSNTNGIYRECAAVIKWYLGRKSSTGRRVYLKKFIHCCSLPGTTATGALGDTALGTSAIADFKTYGNAVKNITVAAIPGGARLVAPDGTGLPLGTDAEVLPYLTVRQFRR